MNDLDESWVGKETLVDYGGDLRMSQPWRGYSNDEIFTIIRKTKAGLYILRDSKGQEYPLKKSAIKYFNGIIKGDRTGSF